jgi:serine/threonine-protein kinase
MAKKQTKKGDPLIGAVIDRRWQVLDQLGAGGMGVVYRAERVQLGRQVALKFLHPSVAESKSGVARFEREAKAISRLHHVHCVSILDFGVYRKQPYIVMEFVQGKQLTELDPGSVTPHRAVALMRQVLLGLQHAHSRGVIHRDLKLSNIMLVEMTGTEDLVKILDFGLARISGVHEELSLDGMMAGTPSYMSPEQAQGKKTDLRTDVYSAGVMLYVLCTGKRPFVASDTRALLYMQANEPPPSPRRLAPGKRISEGLERVILRAMEKRPNDRFQSMSEFLQALDDTQEGQETQTPTVMRDRPRRRWRMIAMAAAACIALGATGALFARAYFLRLRAQAVGTFERWTGPSDSEKQAPPPLEKPAAPPPVEKAAPAPVVEKAAPAPAAEKPAVAAADEAKLPARETDPTAGELPGPPELHEEQASAKTAPPPHVATATPPTPTPHPAREPSPHPRAAPPTAEQRDERQQIEALLADGKIDQAKTQLRDRLALEKKDAWAHLRLGDIYAAPKYHYRRDAFREWDSALALDEGLKSDGAFRKSMCETLDAIEPSREPQFLRDHFGPDETPALLFTCVRVAVEPDRITNAMHLIEITSGPDRPELGQSAMRLLDVGKTCEQKKSAVETIRRLHYARARGSLVKLDKVRLAQKDHPTAATACFGTSIAETIEQLK